jgi:hypothetical protein
MDIELIAARAAKFYTRKWAWDQISPAIQQEIIVGMIPVVDYILSRVLDEIALEVKKYNDSSQQSNNQEILSSTKND